jgi:hypothetical protein
MLKKISFIMGFFILAVPLMAIGFDCNQPDFGARIEDLNTDGFFIKYMEKGGISYSFDLDHTERPDASL